MSARHRGRRRRGEDTPLGIRFGVLGKRWSLLILRQVATEGRPRFTQLLRAHERMSRRLLSVRLRELQREGYIEKVISEANPRRTAYLLTQKGRDALPLLQAFSTLVQRYGEGVPVAKGVPVSVQEICFAHPDIRDGAREASDNAAARSIGFAGTPVPRVTMYKDHCERCRVDLAVSSEAYICSFECTWCRTCAEGFEWRCPNCKEPLRTRPALNSPDPERRGSKAPDLPPRT